MYTRDDFDQITLDTIIALHLPNRSVDNKHWKKMAQMQNPLFPLCSASKISGLLKERLKEVEENLLCRVVPESKIALSLDCWSSKNRLSFMGILAHYVTEDWVLVEEMIGFESLKMVHSGEALAEVVNRVIKQVKMQDRIISITTDNAYSNGTMMKHLNEYRDDPEYGTNMRKLRTCLDDAIRNECFIGGKIPQVPCLAHIIQLAVGALLSTLRLSPKDIPELSRDWDEDNDLQVIEEARSKHIESRIPFILAKVYVLFLFILIFILILSIRCEV